MNKQEGSRPVPVIKVEREDDWFIAIDTTTDVASQGKTEEEARDNLTAALDLFYEKDSAWRFAIGLNRGTVREPSEDFLTLVELEKYMGRNYKCLMERNDEYYTKIKK